jgi:hypothetical protein
MPEPEPSPFGDPTTPPPSISADGEVMRVKDGSTWRIGTDAEVAWIENGTSMGRTITAAIPPVFSAYATFVEPDSDDQWDKHDRAMLALLTKQSAGQLWWLGYLDTGADDIVFPDAPQVTLYYGWHYVLAEAGPEQAATWRKNDRGMHGALPNLMFPADHSWLVSTLWDDDWTCLGGPSGLVDEFLRHPELRARPVALGQDVTTPGY